MSTRFLKYKIDKVHVPQLKLAYINDTTHPSYKNLVMLCREVHYMWWINQQLELQAWEDCVESIKTKKLDMIMLVTNNKPKLYKEHVIYFILFTFGEGVTIIDWIEK